jgi:prolyl-tRNA synthetase
MFVAAKKILDDRTVKASEYSELKSALEKGCFIDAPWCGKTSCEEKIKEETMADIRVIPFECENKDGKCVYCKEKSITNVIFGRAY